MFLSGLLVPYLTICPSEYLSPPTSFSSSNGMIINHYFALIFLNRTTSFSSLAVPDRIFLASFTFKRKSAPEFFVDREI